jgi:putative ABC transport system ATP-binding protein
MTDSRNDQPVVEIRDVVKSFPIGGTMITILKGVSFKVQAGEFVSIVGPSGNGKSTLLNMITGIDRPTSGEIIVTGKQVHKMSEDKLAAWRGENVGIIFQFFQMLPALSILQNVILPMDLAGKYTRHERRERALHLLEIVGLADQANKLPLMVSGGQQQRAAIARALANDPSLLIADEPTGNLDSRTSHDVFDLFSQVVSQGKTMLMVTHDKELARRVPRVVEILDGKITRDEFVGRPTWAGYRTRNWRLKLEIGCVSNFQLLADFKNERHLGKSLVRSLAHEIAHPLGRVEHRGGCVCYWRNVWHGRSNALDDGRRAASGYPRARQDVAGYVH